MVVIAIIGVLSVIAFGEYEKFIIRAQLSEAFVLAEYLGRGAVDHWNATGVIPETLPVQVLNNPATRIETVSYSVGAFQQGTPNTVMAVRVLVDFSNAAHPKLRSTGGIYFIGAPEGVLVEPVQWVTVITGDALTKVKTARVWRWYCVPAPNAVPPNGPITPDMLPNKCQ